MKNPPILPGLAILLITNSLSFAEPPADHQIYFDPADQRIHAAVESTVHSGQLHLSISATGASVEPMPGFTGRAGVNLQTAFEIDQLFAADQLEVITTDASGNRLPHGYLTPGKRGRLPIRSVDADGTIHFDAQTDADYLLDFSAESSALSFGEFRTELWARGEPRLRVDYQVDASGGGRILNFTEMSHGKTPPPNASRDFRYVDTEGKSESLKGDAKLPAPVELAAWQARDFEARWSLYKRSLDAGKTTTEWVSFLLEQKDYEFLETIAMHEIDTFGNAAIGQKLKETDAPNWLRLCFWMAASEKQRGHGGMVVDGLIYDKEQQDVITSWLKHHKLEDKFGAVIGSLSEKEPKPNPVDISKYLPPHDPAKIFQLLDAPEQLAELDSAATQAAPDTVYLQQVKRAIGALVTSGRLQQALLDKLDKLRSHSHPDVRQAVYLGMTFIGPPHIPANLPATINDPSEADRVRQAALLAHSYRTDYEAFPCLLEVALDPLHPAWQASVSRLADLADPYAAAALKELKPEDPTQEAIRKKAVSDLDARLLQMIEKPAARLVQQILFRYGRLKALGHPHADAYLNACEPILKTSKTKIPEEMRALTMPDFQPQATGTSSEKALIDAMNQTVRDVAKFYAPGP